MSLLCDADFLLSLAIVTESTHERAAELARRCLEREWNILDVVLYECVTVASRKYDQTTARQFMEFIRSRPFIFHRAANVEEQAWDEFFSYSKKNISFADCANVIVARKYGLKIASFDAFYPKELLIA